MSKGGRGKCDTCQHRERTAIDLALARGVSLAALAKRSGLSTDSLARHSRNHLPPQLRAKLIAGPSLDGVDLDKLRTSESQSLLLHLVSLRHRLFAALDTAEEHGDAHGLSTLSSQLHKNMELVARLLGDLAVGSTHVTNVLVSPAYVELRGALVGALRAYPAAAQAVAAVLHKLEGKAAAEITADTRQLAGALPRSAPAPVTIEATAEPAPPAPFKMAPPPC